MSTACSRDTVWLSNHYPPHPPSRQPPQILASLGVWCHPCREVGQRPRDSVWLWLSSSAQSWLSWRISQLLANSIVDTPVCGPKIWPMPGAPSECLEMRKTEGRQSIAQCHRQEEGTGLWGWRESTPVEENGVSKPLLLSSQIFFIFFKCFGRCFCNHSKKPVTSASK